MCTQVMAESMNKTLSEMMLMIEASPPMQAMLNLHDAVDMTALREHLEEIEDEMDLDDEVVTAAFAAGCEDDIFDALRHKRTQDRCPHFRRNGLYITHAHVASAIITYACCVCVCARLCMLCDGKYTVTRRTHQSGLMLRVFALAPTREASKVNALARPAGMDGPWLDLFIW